MAWNRSRALLDLKFILQEAEVLWPPREVKEKGGLTRIEQSEAMKTLLNRKAKLVAIDEKTGRRAVREWFKQFDATINALDTPAIRIGKRDAWNRITRRRDTMRDYLG